MKISNFISMSDQVLMYAFTSSVWVQGIIDKGSLYLLHLSWWGHQVPLHGGK